MTSDAQGWVAWEVREKHVVLGDATDLAPWRGGVGLTIDDVFDAGSWIREETLAGWVADVEARVAS